MLFMDHILVDLDQLLSTKTSQKMIFIDNERPVKWQSISITALDNARKGLSLI